MNRASGCLASKILLNCTSVLNNLREVEERLLPALALVQLLELEEKVLLPSEVEELPLLSLVQVQRQGAREQQPGAGARSSLLPQRLLSQQLAQELAWGAAQKLIQIKPQIAKTI